MKNIGKAIRMNRPALVSQSRRCFAMETKKPFAPPPSPPKSSSRDLMQIGIAVVGASIIGYVFLLPENNYGTDFGQMTNEKSDTDTVEVTKEPDNK